MKENLSAPMTSHGLPGSPSSPLAAFAENQDMLNNAL